MEEGARPGFKKAGILQKSPVPVLGGGENEERNVKKQRGARGRPGRRVMEGKVGGRNKSRVKEDGGGDARLRVAQKPQIAEI